MKKRLSFILIVSAFFVLVGCGIPIIFTINSSITVPSGGNTELDILARYRVTQSTSDELAKINPANGPKIFLGYIITDNQDSTVFSNSYIQPAFEKSAGKKPFGSQITSTSYIRGIFTLTKDGVEYTIYPFKDDKNDEFASPDYHIAYQGSNTISSNDQLALDFTISWDDLEKEFKLDLNSNPTYHIRTSNKSLWRFNGSKFGSLSLTDADVKADDISNAYVHFFAATNISQGYFNNIYWSDMKYLGSLPITE